jgi:glucokinase
MTWKKNTVLVLDAGGTNLVFNAVKGGKILVHTFSLPAKSTDLQDFLKKIIHGFHEMNKRTGENVVAISFCFPGPADFENGIIGDLENLPFFRGGVSLKKMLENEFRLPVFINNDGDLFTLGEAIGGLLPEINLKLREKGINKQYKNLLGVTLGTGFGGGIVTGGHLFLGDNSAGGEINRMVDPFNWERSIEETLSIRGLKRLFAEETGLPVDDVPEPYFIYQIGMGKEKGNRHAAVKAWENFATTFADALANTLTLIDGLVVIGGGLSGAYPLFLPKTIELMNRKFTRADGETFPRMEISAFNLEDKHGLKDFLKYEKKVLTVPFSQDKQTYYPKKKTGIGVTRLGTSRSVAIGAYAYAMERLGK